MTADLMPVLLEAEERMLYERGDGVVRSLLRRVSIERQRGRGLLLAMEWIAEARGLHSGDTLRDVQRSAREAVEVYRAGEPT